MTSANKSLIVHNADWQYPAVTEQHAYLTLKNWLPQTKGVYYVAFPWATLIDQVNKNGVSNAPLLKDLKALNLQSLKGSRLITVCQHILMRKFKHIFIKHGITDVFWSHSTNGGEEEKYLQENDLKVIIHPFPLYPVQFDDGRPMHPDDDTSFFKRPHLFSFVGAKANEWYLTQSRSWILDNLSGDSRGFVRGRDSWHFNKIVYDHQIDQNTNNDNKDLVCQDATEQYKTILKNTIFSLCPSGTGPNSIRLWESIGAGCIPVILADSHLLPGNQTLWEQATIRCKETPEDIKALSNTLSSLAKSQEDLKAKRMACNQLWLLYGPDNFTNDVKSLWIEYATSAKLQQKNIEFMEAGNESELEHILLHYVKKASKEKTLTWKEANLFLNACVNQLLLNAEVFKSSCQNSPRLRAIIKSARLKLDGAATDKSLLRVLSSKGWSIHDLLGSSSSQINAPKLDRKKLALFGKHSNRTPFAYHEYRKLFSQNYEYIETPENADFIASGFEVDFTHHPSECKTILAQKPSASLINCSEEPLWDTVWSKEFRTPTIPLSVEKKHPKIRVINHENSNVFEFHKIPYFITTDNNYFVRYSNLFTQNSKLTAEEVLHIWQNSSVDFAFFAEQREDDRYNYNLPDEDIYGLSVLRTQIAQTFTAMPSTLTVGKGWNTNAPRQKLADWHLDKIATLNRRSKIVSGIENTHQINYISEKIFDAYSVLATPVYYASPNHNIHKIVSPDSFINIFELTASEAATKIKNFKPDLKHAQNYLETQRKLAKLFSNPQTLLNERCQVVDKIADLLDSPR